MAGPDLRILVTLKDKASKALGAISKKAKGLGSAVGKVMRAGVLAGAVGIAALGVAAFKFGNDFKKATNIIRVGTGATGEDLKALNEDFKAAFADTPADMKTVAQATADLNTRLGLTGKPLQDMTKRFVELSRITETDVTANIEAVTRLFGDWSVATEDQSGSLDRLFKTSQATGIGVDKLSQLVVQFGAPLRGFGFTLDESTAILAKFEKEGVNTEAVMGGLKIGLGKVAAAGKDPAIELAKVSEAIKTAGSAGEANVAAIEMFGSRAGPDMAAAIREGRFEVEEFIAQMDAGGQGILETAEATKTWQEKLTLLRNKVLVKLEPVLVKFVDLIGDLADWLGDKIPVAIDGFIAGFKEADVTSTGFFGTMEKIGKGVREFIDGARPIVERFARAFVSGLKTLREAFEPLVRFILNNKPALIAAIAAIGIAILLAFGPGAIAIAAIIGLIVLIGLVRENFDSWKETVEEFVDAVIAKIEGLPVIGEIFKATVRVITDKIVALKGFIQGLIDFVQELVSFVSAIFRGDWAAAWDSLKEMAKIALNLFLDYLQLTFVGTLRSILRGINPWNWIKGPINTAKNNIIGAFTGAKDGVLDAFRTIRDTAPKMIRAMATGIKGGINAMITFFERGINNIIRAWNSLEFRLPKVDLGPLGSLGGGSIGTPNIPMVRLPRLDKGGEILRTGVAVVHEGEEFTRKGGRAQVFERGAFEGAQFIVSDPEDLFNQLRRLGTA